MRFAWISLPTSPSSGLLHDLGRFGLALAMPAQYAKLARADGYVDVLDAEYTLFGTDHPAAGRPLAEKFDLPDEIRIVAGRHHDRLDGTEIDNLAVVATACAIAGAAGFQVVASAIPNSLDSVVANAPARLREFIEPDIEFWKTALLDIVDTP